MIKKFENSVGFYKMTVLTSLVVALSGCTTQGYDRTYDRDIILQKTISRISSNTSNAIELIELVKEFEKKKADFYGNGYIDYIYIREVATQQISKLLRRAIDQNDTIKINEFSRILLWLDPGNELLKIAYENDIIKDDVLGLNSNQTHLFSRLAPSSPVASAYNIMVHQSVFNSLHDGRSYKNLYEILKKPIEKNAPPVEAPLMTQMGYLSTKYGFKFICDTSVANNKNLTPKNISNIEKSSQPSVLKHLGDVAFAYDVNMIILPDQVHCFSGESPKDEIEGGEYVSVFKAEFVSLELLVGLLKMTLGSSSIVMVDEPTKTVWIRGGRTKFMQAFELVRTVDVPEAEIEIQMELYEVSSSLLHRIGMRVPQLVRAGIGNAMDGGAMNWNTWLNQAKSKSMRVMISDGAFQLNAQSRNMFATTLSQPRIRVQDGQRARLFVGDKTPVFSSTVGQGGFVSESVNYVSTGVTLEVEAKIVGSNSIQIAVNVDATELGAPVSTSTGSTANAVTSRTTVTRITIEDGATEALGGYVRRIKTKSRDGLPGIGATDMAVLGGARDAQNSDVELLIFITPKIVKAKSSPSKKTLMESQANSPRYAAPLINSQNMNSPVRMLFQTPQLNAQTTGQNLNVINLGGNQQMPNVGQNSTLQQNMLENPAFQQNMMNPMQAGGGNNPDGALGGRGGGRR